MGVRSSARQPISPAFGGSLQPAPHRAGNPGISCIRLCLWVPDHSLSGAELPKVSGPVREYSRFWETNGGDKFDQYCRPRRHLICVYLAFQRKLSVHEGDVRSKESSVTPLVLPTTRMINSSLMSSVDGAVAYGTPKRTKT